ncbi:C39 family peptidase [Neoroseomonas eburnea]|uniref:C39 family peptidase n=1 Tax=Neoroseomonas eburnea TaxID=1346889 RepID=UPI001FEC108C|nr:C39 family peptidase [Neoroseomonas eburnea]
MIPPYFGQWESADCIADIITGTLKAEEDPLWAASGARDAAEYAEWADHLCGVACLRMALGARGIAPPRAFDLARELTGRGGYVVRPDGSIRGLIYAPAATWLREAHGIAAEVRVDVPAEDIPSLLADRGMFIASVHPAVRRPETEPPARGGHLVLVFGTAEEKLRFHNPSGHDAASQTDARLAVDAFARFYAGRGIWLPG